MKSLPRVFEKYPEIRAVYLFGSSAIGRARSDSDLDLAIYPGSESLSKQKVGILSDLARAGFCNVDLVFLYRDDIVLQFEVVRHNTIVYQTPDFEKGAVYSEIIRKYFDFYPYLEFQRQAYKERILNG